MRLFSAWAGEFGAGDVRLVGCDLPLHAKASEYRAVVERMKRDRNVVGGLITTHKIDVFESCMDMFDSVDGFAELCGEASALSVRDGLVSAYATDPISSARAYDDFHPSRDPADVLCLGGGGSATAITVQLLQRRLARRITVVDVNPDRLARIEAVHERLEHSGGLSYVEGAGSSDRLVRELPPGSVVINATGLGKDLPGSPLSDEAAFPEGGYAWDLNYRGDLRFLQQARRRGDLHVEDGWRYFVHGWAAVMSRVFDVDVDAGLTERLAAIAAAERPAPG
jgi:shikimate 5-dehydrogenase